MYTLHYRHHKYILTPPRTHLPRGPAQQVRNTRDYVQREPARYINARKRREKRNAHIEQRKQQTIRKAVCRSDAAQALGEKGIVEENRERKQSRYQTQYTTKKGICKNNAKSSVHRTFPARKTPSPLRMYKEWSWTRERKDIETLCRRCRVTLLAAEDGTGAALVPGFLFGVVLLA
jgi:hypothetical protein